MNEMNALTTDRKIVEMIDALNVTSLADREAVVFARHSYEKLDNTQKALVTNVQLLEKAEAQILKLWIDENTLGKRGLTGVLTREYNELK